MSELPPGAVRDLAAPSTSQTQMPCARTAGRPREADIEAREQQLLETAGRLFLEHGYSKASLGMIAREAHVAIRTIYVKFGGKAGLFKAVIAHGRSRYFMIADMDSDMRAPDVILGQFGVRLLQLMSMPQVVALHRMVIAEATSNPELAVAFDRAGPGQILDMLGRYFTRADVRQQFRPDMAPDALALHLFNCILGDQVSRLMFEAHPVPNDAALRLKVAQGLEFFFKTTSHAGSGA